MRPNGRRREQADRVPVPQGGLEVFRFVRVAGIDDPLLAEDFLSDRQRGKRPLGRSVRIPELQDGLSVFRSIETARHRWADIAERVRGRDPAKPMKIGDFVATVFLGGNSELFYEDLGGVDGHMTIWGDPEILAAAVTHIQRLGS